MTPPELEPAPPIAGTALRLAVGLCVAGGLLASLSRIYAVLCSAAVLCGTGASTGMITIQRSAGRRARQVPKEAVRTRAVTRAPRRAAWGLLRLAPLRRLMLVNWRLSASWDVHSFVLPVLGHARDMSASAIGTILRLFAFAVAAVRFMLPMMAHRLQECQVLVGAMLSTAVVFGIYPLMPTVWLMALCAVLLGMSLGSVQPMIMLTLHHITPPDRYSEAIALRSMAINASSTAMPLLFGIVGAALGAGALFWVMGLAVGAGSLAARRV